MTTAKRNGGIDALLQSGDWLAARSRLEREREREPENHWVLTQLGVTYYEQRKYRDALRLFLESRNIMPECPLTLWNLAGSLDALGYHTGAIRLYTWLLQSEKTPDDDPCWESKEWTDALKADCVFRLGIVFQYTKKKQKAERCYRQYVNLLALGIGGIYSIDDVKRQMQELRGDSAPNGVERDFHDAVKAALEIAGFEAPKGGKAIPPPDVRIPRLVVN